MEFRFETRRSVDGEIDSLRVEDRGSRIYGAKSDKGQIRKKERTGKELTKFFESFPEAISDEDRVHESRDGEGESDEGLEDLGDRGNDLEIFYARKGLLEEMHRSNGDCSQWKEYVASDLAARAFPSDSRRVVSIRGFPS